MQLSAQQIKFRDDFLSPLKQRLYFLKNLPMGFISGIRLIHLDQDKSVVTVPNRWLNKNPFRSMYFAVQSMAAELSTAAPVKLALYGFDADIALIIVNIKADFVKKAQSELTFVCLDYEEIFNTVSGLAQAGDSATVTVKTIGKDADGDEVASFDFTWSFKRRG
jgi:hypothetical protein